MSNQVAYLSLDVTGNYVEGAAIAPSYPTSKGYFEIYDTSLNLSIFDRTYFVEGDFQPFPVVVPTVQATPEPYEDLLTGEMITPEVELVVVEPDTRDLPPEGTVLTGTFKRSTGVYSTGAFVRRADSSSPVYDEVEGYWVIAAPEVGTAISIYDRIGEESLFDAVVDTTDNIEFTLVDSGVFEVLVKEPFPKVQTITRIEVE